MSDTTLAGRSVVVTGATSGIGLAVAEHFAAQGAFVIGVGRSAARCQTAEQRLQQAYPGSHITYVVADLSLQSEVRGLAARIYELLQRAGLHHLDALINNAATFTYWFELTPEGFETQWAVNHLAPFLLTHELLPLIRTAPAGRIVNVSSQSHYGARLNWDDIQLRRTYTGLRAYERTKLANILFTVELNARLGEHTSVRAFAADPGLVKTDIGAKNTPSFARWAWNVRRSAGIQPEDAARGVVFLATEASIQESNDPYWRHGTPRRANANALDQHAATRLWQLSAQMCGV
ncbi:MAG TPA: SDR family NAD(P)-dependent oxidoreductase [Roseiflexaceae bacterium]|nr:SDR family NAD(P)-dependent oxidoreductase [Roseiflexaceae bacterium]